MSSPPPVHLFVYGTLRPGDVRWPLLAPFVRDGGTEDSVAGDLFDTGRGYPAAIFGGSSSIVGRTYRLVDESIDDALRVLDAEEGSVTGLYRRVALTTHRAVTAWAYEYGAGLQQLVRIPSGDWFAR